jgi:REP element-mobilizing transposase RayT
MDSVQPFAAQAPLADRTFLAIDAKTGLFPGARSWSGGRFRVLGQPDQKARYHVMSRTCGGEVHWSDLEKEALRRLLWKMSAFLGVRVLTYCVMKNHFHALVEIPHRDAWVQRFDGPDGEVRLLQHLSTFYSRSYLALLRRQLTYLRSQEREAEAQALLNRYRIRFCDLSIWVKEVKERFSRWYNKRHGRKGTLWMDRFKSVLVEEGDALRTMAGYIDLNPVRAGLVERPEAYRWCGYSEALAGSRRARRGLMGLVGARGDDWSHALESYRGWIYEAGRAVEAPDERMARRGMTDEATRAVTVGQTKLTAAELIRHRVRYFTDGLALGSKGFVEEVFLRHRQRFGPRRTTGARPLREADRRLGLNALRALRVQAIT